MNREIVAVAKGKTSREPAFWNKHCKKADFDMLKDVRHALR